MVFTYYLLVTYISEVICDHNSAHANPLSAFVYVSINLLNTKSFGFFCCQQTHCMVISLQYVRIQYASFFLFSLASDPCWGLLIWMKMVYLYCP